MRITLDDYRCQLINKILFATRPEEIQELIESALKSLHDHNVNGYVIARFIDKINNDLNKFIPIDYDAQQWANIHLAKIVFYRLSNKVETTSTF